MRLRAIFLVALIANFSFANVVKRATDGDSNEVANEFEESSDQQGAVEETNDHVEGTEQHESDDHGEAENQEHNEEEPAEEDTVAEEGVEPVENDEDEQAEGSPEPTDELEAQDKEEGASENEEDGNENEDASGENIEAEIEEETEEPAKEADETEQPAGAEPSEENTETSDETGETENLPPAIVTDLPKSEKPTDAAAEQSWVDDFGWTHYPWKKFPITKLRYTHTKDCGCKIKWIKKVYRRRHPKPIVVLAHSSYIKFPHRHHHHHHGHFPPVHHHHHVHRPCRRHRHHHHVFHRKPIRTVQHVVVNHVPKPCFKKPIVKYITKVHHARS